MTPRFQVRAKLQPRSPDAPHPTPPPTSFFRLFMPRYRLLAIDIDGTLLNSRDELTDRTRQALLRATESGMRIVLATGRRYSRALPLVARLGLDAPLVPASGALIKHPL